MKKSICSLCELATIRLVFVLFLFFYFAHREQKDIGKLDSDNERTKKIMERLIKNLTEKNLFGYLTENCDLITIHKGLEHINIYWKKIIKSALGRHNLK